jgi:hypothetical protein
MRGLATQARDDNIKTRACLLRRGGSISAVRYDAKSKKMSNSFDPELPNQIVCIRDDLVAQTFLLALGVLDKLPNESTLANSISKQVNTIFVAHYTHATHWILACRFHGMDDEKENGFVVWAWPKDKYPKTVVKDAIDRQNYGTPITRNDFRIGDVPLS